MEKDLYKEIENIMKGVSANNKKHKKCLVEEVKGYDKYDNAPYEFTRTFVYDTNGNFISCITSNGLIEINTYDSNNRLVDTFDNRVHDTYHKKYFYNEEGLLSSTIDNSYGGDECELYKYDSNGNEIIRVLKATDSDLRVECKYDDENRLIHRLYTRIYDEEIGLEDGVEEVFIEYKDKYTSYEELYTNKELEYTVTVTKDDKGRIIKQEYNTGVYLNYIYQNDLLVRVESNVDENRIEYEYNEYGDPILITRKDDIVKSTYTYYED